jgi:hypothetical protein
VDATLQRLILSRLEADSQIPDDAAVCVIAACEGREALEGVLGGGATASATTAAGVVPFEPLGAYLSSVTVEGFRGIGPRATLHLAPGPGLTLVAGRNGTGKSSFAEGLEILLTGDSYRWHGRSQIWKEGWRNLHHGDHAAVEATFSVLDLLNAAGEDEDAEQA